MSAKAPKREPKKEAGAPADAPASLFSRRGSFMIPRRGDLLGELIRYEKPYSVALPLLAVREHFRQTGGPEL